MRIKCKYCSGSAKQLGKGMIPEKCSQCMNGWIDDEANNLESDFKIEKIDKRSVAYRTAISNIMNSKKNMTRAEAVKLFNEASKNYES